VHIDQKVQFVNDGGVFELRLRILDKRRGPAGEGDAIVPRELQAILEKVVEVIAHAAIGTINGGGVDTLGFVGRAGFEHVKRYIRFRGS
jgi:hypothetical protein